MPENVGAALKRLREERGLSKSRLAREAAVSDAYIVQIEKGDRTNPSEDVLRRVARVLRVPPYLLLVPAGVYSTETLARADALAADELDHYGLTRESAPAGVWDRVFNRALDEAETQEWLMSGGYNGDELDVLPDDEYWSRGGRHAWAPEGWERLSPADQRMVQQLITRLLAAPQVERAD